MQRRTLLTALAAIVAASTCLSFFENHVATAADRPSILWIVSEDNGPFLGCYGDEFADTPNLDRMARSGILYENAVANAPVCAPARSTIITGVYAAAMGTHHMRSSNRIPTGTIKLFPAYLREAGYFTSNRSKTDYNLSPVEKDAWNQIGGGHWRNRDSGQPFFSVFNIGTSHESSLHGSKVEPEYLKEDFQLPPYHPDTPEIRSNWVQYYRIITKMDAQVGEILADLERDGLAEDTIVFYYADHGGILTRSKRFLFDTGVHVPMIVRFPKRWQHLAPAKPGSRLDRNVAFVDLAPTVLSLAGIDAPEYMQGVAFLCPKAGEPRGYNYVFRGRMDERYDMMRAVRDGQYKYINNYMPHRIYGQHLNYLWKMPATQSWERAFKAGKTNEVQSRFFGPKPAEELYDHTKDPWEVNNLAGDPAYADVLKRMREANRQHLLQIRDAGFLPESEMGDRAARNDTTIYEMARDEELYPLKRLIEAAETASSRDAGTVPKLIEYMGDADPGIRYWGAVGCAVLEKQAAAAAEKLRKLLEDPTPCVRITAAEALWRMGHADEARPVIVAALEASDSWAALRAVNVLQALGPDALKAALPELEKAAKRGGYVQRAAQWAVESVGKE